MLTKLLIKLKIIQPYPKEIPIEEEPECKHDWATVKEYDKKELLNSMIGVVNITGLKRNTWIYNQYRAVDVWAFDFDIGFPPGGSKPILLQSADFYVKKGMVYDKVCLTCGECSQGKKNFISEIMGKYHAKVQHDENMKERKAIATKMWEEGCKNDR
jgi:hypothetical protein